jgi:lipopolysaccharide export system permease protein
MLSPASRLPPSRRDWTRPDAPRGGRLITRVDRYVFRQLFGALIIVTGGLTALVWLTQSLRFVELVVNRGLSAAVFLHLTGLLIPSFLVVILPITTYIVVQFVYYRLSGDRELTVMRSAGLSPFMLSRPALVVAILSVLGGYALSLWIVPATLFQFRAFQWEIRNTIAAFLLQEGVFTSISDKLTVYVRSRGTDGTMTGIMVDDARDGTAHATVFAERGQLLDGPRGPRGPRVLLFNGSRQEIDHHTGRLNILTFQQNEIDLAETAREVAHQFREMAEVSLADLLNPNPPSPGDVPRWYAEGHRRLTLPLTALSYTLVALHSGLAGAFRRHGGMLRPLLNVLVVVVLLGGGLGISNFAARDNAWVPLMWIHALGPGLIAAWLLYAPMLGGRTLPRAA